MHVTNGKKKNMKIIISIKKKLDVVENGEGKQKDIMNQWPTAPKNQDRYLKVH